MLQTLESRRKYIGAILSDEHTPRSQSIGLNHRSIKWLLCHGNIGLYGLVFHEVILIVF